jgi:hypothetical protein
MLCWRGFDASCTPPLAASCENSVLGLRLEHRPVVTVVAKAPRLYPSPGRGGMLHDDVTETAVDSLDLCIVLPGKSVQIP